MGSYLYSVRTKSVETTNFGRAYALAYLTKPWWDFGRVDTRTNRLVCAAEATWDRRNEKPTLVYLTGDDKNRPQDGSTVYEWDGRATDWDTPCFEGAKKTVGFLRSRKVGRKTVWSVVPVVYEVTVGKNEGRFIRERGTCFTVQEILAWAKANCRPGESVRVCTYKATDYRETAAERVGAPTEEGLNKMTERLLTGPWPVSPLNPDTLTPDEKAAANKLLTEGKVVLHAEKYEGDSEDAPAWHGNLYYKATVALLGLKSSDYHLNVALEDRQVVFKGGKYGEHSLDRLSSDLEHVRVHWEGYCENNGAQAL